MKLAWLCPYPLTSLKGIRLDRVPSSEHPSTWIVTLAMALKREASDLDFHIVTESAWVRRDLSCEEDGIHFHVLRSGGLPPMVLRGWPEWFPLDVYRRFKPNIRRLVEAVRVIGPDVVHAHGTERAYGLGAIASGKPSIVSLQGIVNEIFRDKTGRAWSIRKALEVECVMQGRNFIAKTPFARDFIKRHNPSATIFEIENPVHEAFHQREARPGTGRRLVFVGSLVPEKGLADLLVALAHIPESTLAIVGDGPLSYVAELQAMAQHSGVAARVTWMGVRNHVEVAEIVAASDVLVLPSHMETSPNVVAEAMSLGIPVVASNVGGIPALVRNGVTGSLVPRGDTAALARALNELLAQPDLMARMGRSAREDARTRFLPRAAAAKTLLAYDAVMRRG